MGTYSGVRIVRSATGLQDQDDLDEVLMEDNRQEQPSQPVDGSLVTVLYRNAQTDMRMRNYVFRNGTPLIGDRPRRPHPSDTRMVVTSRPRRSSTNLVFSCSNRYQVPLGHKIHKNNERLTHYIEEANVGRGYIKELCYSNDGRIICSPFSHGVRLLSFSPSCDELSTLQPTSPGVKLHEIGTNISHSNIVLCTKFSPVHPLLVSGCLEGRIVWYQPRI